VSHYGAVWRHHWRQRNAQQGVGPLTAQEAAFLPAALELQERPVSPTARWLAGMLMVMVWGALVWSILGRVDILVNAGGRVISRTRTQSIASVEVASVRTIAVSDGQAVRRNDVLMVLDASAPDAERDKASGEQRGATLAMARAKALIAAIETDRPPRLASVAGVTPEVLRSAQQHLDGQYHDLCARLQRVDSEMARYRALLTLARQREGDYADLAQQGDVSRHAWLEKQQARIELEGQLREADNQRAALLTEAMRQAYDVVADGRRLAAAAQQDVRKASAHGQLLTLRAPLDGTVQQLQVHTEGGVVAAAQPLMLIVPQQQNAEVEAMIDNKDIGFIHEGQPVQVKVDAYDYTRYGTVPGRVARIARDAQQDDKRGLLYAVSVALDQSYLEVDGVQRPLGAGMAVNVEIKTGARRVVDYLLSPLQQHRSESLHER
jgi:hemolysin D